MLTKLGSGFRHSVEWLQQSRHKRNFENGNSHRRKNVLDPIDEALTQLASINRGNQMNIA